MPIFVFFFSDKRVIKYGGITSQKRSGKRFGTLVDEKIYIHFFSIVEDGISSVSASVEEN